MDIESGRSEKPSQLLPKNRLLLGVGLAIQIGLSVLVFWFYDALYNRSPAGCAALVSMSLCATSQLLVQLFTNRFDLSRLVKFYVWGAQNGIWTRFWTEQLTNKLEWTITKVLWDQIYGNSMGIFMYISLSGYWEGYNLTLYLQENYWNSLKASWLVWPVASLVQFYVVPHRYIALFNTAVNFVWTIVLGLIA